MAAYKDRLIEAADLLGMTPDDLLSALSADVYCKVHGYVPAQSGGGCRLCDEEDDTPWPADSPEGRDVAAMRARDDAR